MSNCYISCVIPQHSKRTFLHSPKNGEPSDEVDYQSEESARYYSDFFSPSSEEEYVYLRQSALLPGVQDSCTVDKERNSSNLKNIVLRIFSLWFPGEPS